MQAVAAWPLARMVEMPPLRVVLPEARVEALGGEALALEPQW